MPELPEVEVLVRHLRPQLIGQTLRQIQVHHPSTPFPTSAKQLIKTLEGSTLRSISRRGKFMLFGFHSCRSDDVGTEYAVAHLGMTGRMFIQPASTPLPRHTSVSWTLQDRRFVFVDPRKFGRFTLDTTSVERLGPEPLDAALSAMEFTRQLRASSQCVKVRLMDQAVVAGIGNIYASEILFDAGVRPTRRCLRLSRAQGAAILGAARRVLSRAILMGGSLPLDFTASGKGGLFYYGTTRNPVPEPPGESFTVYDRAGQPCKRCRARIRRVIQAARSTYFCPGCQV